MGHDLASFRLGDPPDIANPLPVNIPDVKLSEVAGHYSDREVIQKFGRNPTATAGALELVALSAEAFAGFLTAASAVRVKAGGNAADDSDAGLGARTICVEGLNADYIPCSTILTTEGADVSAASTQTFIRVWRAYVCDVGTYGGANTGVVTIETTTGAQVAVIAATHGQTELCLYTVPFGRTAYIRSFAATVEGGKPADVHLFQRQEAHVIAAPFTGRRLVHIFAALSGPSHHPFEAYKGPFSEKTDIFVMAEAFAGNSPSVSSSFDVVMINNE